MIGLVIMSKSQVIAWFGVVINMTHKTSKKIIKIPQNWRHIYQVQKRVFACSDRVQVHWKICQRCWFRSIYCQEDRASNCGQYHQVYLLLDCCHANKQDMINCEMNTFQPSTLEFSCLSDEPLLPSTNNQRYAMR